MLGSIDVFVGDVLRLGKIVYFSRERCASAQNTLTFHCSNSWPKQRIEHVMYITRLGEAVARCVKDVAQCAGISNEEVFLL